MSLLESVQNPKFNLNQYLNQVNTNSTRSGGGKTAFERTVQTLDAYLQRLWEKDTDEYMSRQHQAIIGDASAKAFFMQEIQNFLRINPTHAQVRPPEYYSDLSEALFHTLLGFGPMSIWFKNPTASAKVNGTAILFETETGDKELQPFRYNSLDEVRRLIRSITLRDAYTQITPLKPWGEMDMLDGTRVSIMDSPLTEVPVLTFRQYTVKRFTFEEQAKRNTIPMDAVHWLRSLSRLYLNTVVTGNVESGKTTLLKTIFDARNPHDEIVTLERDSFEVHLRRDFPERADYITPVKTTLDNLKVVFPSLLRTDSRYLIVPEVRSGELELLLLAYERGGGYLATYHSPHVVDIPSEFARQTLNDFPQRSFIEEYKRAARSLDVVIVMDKLPGGRKVVSGVYAYSYEYNATTNESRLTVTPWMEYSDAARAWHFHCDIPNSLLQKCGSSHSRHELQAFESHLRELAEKHPHPQAVSQTIQI